MVSIVYDILNLINIVEAQIPVNHNLCGFVPATLEIQDKVKGNVFLYFGDIVVLESPKIIHRVLSVISPIQLIFRKFNKLC